MTCSALSINFGALLTGIEADDFVDLRSLLRDLRTGARLPQMMTYGRYRCGVSPSISQRVAFAPRQSLARIALRRIRRVRTILWRS
jgi:hypothetical protein